MCVIIVRFSLVICTQYTYRLSDALTFEKHLCRYNCSFGLNDKRGKNPTKRRVNSFVKIRGCQCHSIVKVMVSNPNVAILTYNNYEHKDTQGFPCHGRHDTLGEPRSMHKTRFSRDIISYVESCFYFDMPVDSMCKMHINKHVDIDATNQDRYLFLCRKDVENIYNQENISFTKKMSEV